MSAMQSLMQALGTLRRSHRPAVRFGADAVLATYRCVSAPSGSALTACTALSHFSGCCGPGISIKPHA